MSLEIYAKLLMGRRLSKEDSRPAFFKIGRIIASFQSLGNARYYSL